MSDAQLRQGKKILTQMAKAERAKDTGDEDGALSDCSECFKKGSGLVSMRPNAQASREAKKALLNKVVWKITYNRMEAGGDFYDRPYVDAPHSMMARKEYEISLQVRPQ